MRNEDNAPFRRRFRLTYENNRTKKNNGVLRLTRKELINFSLVSSENQFRNRWKLRKNYSSVLAAVTKRRRRKYVECVRYRKQKKNIFSMLKLHYNELIASARIKLKLNRKIRKVNRKKWFKRVKSLFTTKIPCKNFTITTVTCE